MTSNTSQKPVPALLTAPLALTLDVSTISDLNEYRQATYAEQWPPENLTGPELKAYVRHQQQLAIDAAKGVALYLDNLIGKK